MLLNALSCIEVAICTRLITRPAMKPITSNGADSQNVAINWQGFSIGQGEAVKFVQPNSSSVALNRVLGPDASSILGSMSANGKVFLVTTGGGAGIRHRPNHMPR